MTSHISLTTAKLLKEAGWEQDKSDWVWLPKGGRICGGYCDGGTTHIKYTGKFEGEKQEENRLIFAAGTGAGTSHEGTHVSESEYGNDNDLHHLDFIAAPSTDELLEALNKNFKKEQVILHSDVRGDEIIWTASRHFWNDIEDDNGIPVDGPTPAEALALLWLELRKQKMV